jgi:hypothetical protein
VKIRIATLAAALLPALAIFECATAGHAATGTSAPSALQASASSAAWRKAEQVPGLAALAGAGDSALNAVSCASAGNCSAGGTYQLGTDISRSEAFVVSQVSGTWTNAETVPGITALNTMGKAQVSSVSCATPGDCSAGGFYTSGFYPGGHATMSSAFVVSQINGVWGKARQVPGMAALNQGGQANVASVSCTSPGNCSAGGFFDEAPSGPGCCTSRGFVVSEVNGVWGKARAVPGTGSIYSVSCATSGNCGAAGTRVLSQVNGVWGPARRVVPAKGSTFGSARITVISCPAKGACSAGGIGNKEARSIVASQVRGVWGTARQVAGTATLQAKRKSALVSTVSCITSGTCTGGGYAFRTEAAGSSTRMFAVPYLVRQKAGIWGRAEKITGIGTLSKYGYAVITGVSCATARNCAAAGRYSTSSYNPEGSGPGQAFVLNEINGRWGVPRDVTSSLTNDGPAVIAGISCPAVTACTAGGNYWLGQQERAFVVSQAG